MRSLVFLALVGAVMSQRGVSKSGPAAPPLILRQAAEVNTDGSFQYSYETENGIRVAESGYLKNAGSQDEAQSVQGSYSYIAPDGTPISLTYTADENGFLADGAHLPVAPEVPEVPALIAKALAYNAANAGVGGDNDGQTRPRPFGPKPTKTRRLPVIGQSSPTYQSGFASGTEI